MALSSGREDISARIDAVCLGSRASFAWIFAILVSRLSAISPDPLRRLDSTRGGKGICDCGHTVADMGEAVAV
jgi:hypothetical protein